jgi:putative Mg2+ transporter-C (MgtC) family protein
VKVGDGELGARLLFSLLFGLLVGIERQWHHKNAGLKTNCLVTLGAAAFTIIAQTGFNNPSQVAAGVLTGIGFIGAGVIIRHGDSIQGVNSAATLWVTAAGGMVVGVGHYRLAIMLLILVLLTQFLVRKLANWIDIRSGEAARIPQNSEMAKSGPVDVDRGN